MLALGQGGDLNSEGTDILFIPDIEGAPRKAHAAVLVVGAAVVAMHSAERAVLGDAGSPASDQTLLPTAVFNLDGQHDHIWDTCVPSFICCNVPILIICSICACIM